jgi:glucose-6-phosphate 1-dehydrogenase
MANMNDRPAPSDALVLFGVSGDLAHKMIFPALYAMVKRGVLTVPVVGVASTPWSVARLRERAADSIKQSGPVENHASPLGGPADGLARSDRARPGRSHVSQGR